MLTKGVAVGIFSGQATSIGTPLHPTPELSVHFIDCGQGNMTLLVTPTATVMYDCRITSDDEERILGHLKDYIPYREIDGEKEHWIDWFICSHRDKDHIHGLESLNREFPIRGIVDPGTTSGSTDGDENKYYMGLRLRVKEAYGKEALIEPSPSASPLFDFGGVRFYCLCSGFDDPPSTDGHYGNNVFQVEYFGNRILLTGDSDWRAWKERIVPAFKASGLLATTVLVASHHGSRSFFLDVEPDVDEDEAWESAFETHLGLINPKSTVISCGAQEIHNHPNETALKKYRQATAHNQTYLTREIGTLIGQFHSNGWWTVTPARFLKKWVHANACTPGKEIQVRCSAFDGERFVGEVKNGGDLRIGHKLRFEVAISGPAAVTALTDFNFEVSNGGSGRHLDRDDIYSENKAGKGRPNTFQRDLSFLGLHLLRCNVNGPGIAGQFIFSVRGTES